MSSAQGATERGAGQGTIRKQAIGSEQPQQMPALGLPHFLLNAEQMKKAEDRIRGTTGLGHMPRGWTSTNVKHCFSYPGFLKAHEWTLLAGPLGKYALQGLLPAALESPLFMYLDLLAQLGAKEISAASVATLQEDAAIALAQMELFFPAWELDINRHMIIHIPEQITSRGPPWAWSMWAYERFWNRMMQWKTQDKNPAATMVNSYKVFKTAHAALVQNGEKNAHWMSFDRESDEVLLPAYIRDSGRMSYELSDPRPLLFLNELKAQRLHLREELHALHLRINADYNQVWTDYVSSLGQDAANLKVMQAGKLLAGWKVWGNEQSVSGEHRMFTWGPHAEVRLYDRASINGSRFVVTDHQNGVYKNDIVMMRTTGRAAEFGKVVAFIEHAPAGFSFARTAEDLNPDDFERAALVQWFASAAGVSGGPLAVSTDVRSDVDNGNVWRISDLEPVNVALVPRVMIRGGTSEREWQVMFSRPLAI
jgi:hypothetical protein